MSNSGESDELRMLVPAVRRLRVPILAVTRNTENTLARHADLVLQFGKHQEAGELALAPSCSTIAMLAVGDALALVLSQLKGFSAGDFAEVHPAGSLGRQLCPVKDVMRSGSALRIALEHQTVREVMIAQSRPGRRTGAVMITSDAGRLTGLFTDSDLARLFENRRDDQLDQPIREVMTCNPITVSPDVRLPDAIHLMSSRKLSELPVVDAQRHPLGMLDITDVIQTVDAVDQLPGEAPAADPESLLRKSA
jgi:arabinose-5-phosphate isomerase